MGKRGFTTLIVVAALLGCNEVPVSHVLEGFVVQVEGTVENTATVNLDILWVIDNSVSMCQEQNSLSESISAFLEKFAASDLRPR